VIGADILAWIVVANAAPPKNKKNSLRVFVAINRPPLTKADFAQIDTAITVGTKNLNVRIGFERNHIVARYHYELRGCNTTAPVTAFSFSAVPIIQGKTGEFAFCANQEGVVWYAKGGPAGECFKARTRWPKSDYLARN
jgi:hypothetical protein